MYFFSFFILGSFAHFTKAHWKAHCEKYQTNNYCYAYRLQFELSFETAVKFCNAIGGKLFAPQNWDELDEVKRAQKFAYRYVDQWIGIRKYDAHWKR